MDLHIHMPENALPKDGPSAGITIATALISAITGRAVQSSLAMTGEITLRGRVLAIGGLKEKVLAAHHSHIHNLIIPLENKKDLVEIPEKIRNAIHFTIVDSMDQVIDAALLPGFDIAQEEPEEEPATAMRPVSLDERHPDRRQRAALPVEDQADGENTPEQDLIIPPDRLPGENYPPASAGDQPAH